MQAVTPHNCFHDLPTELLRDILEIAASRDHATSLSLALVSSWTRQWTQHMLFHTVILETARALRGFHAALQRLPTDFPATHVKHLGIFAPGPHQTIEKVIQACSGVESFACSSLAPSPSPRTSPAPAPKEQHLLALACRDGWDPTMVRPSVARLRLHLTAPADFARLPTLDALPHLSHVALVYRAGLAPTPAVAQALLDLLDAVPLRLLLVQVVGRRNAAHNREVDALNRAAGARRLVAEHAPFSVVAQWEGAARRGTNVWETAEHELKERKRRWSEPAGNESGRALFRMSYA